jgi:hypothetical protein
MFKFKSKRMFFNFIMLFNFNLQRKNKQLKITAGIYTVHIYKTFCEKCRAHLFVVGAPT